MKQHVYIHSPRHFIVQPLQVANFTYLVNGLFSKVECEGSFQPCVKFAFVPTECTCFSVVQFLTIIILLEFPFELLYWVSSTRRVVHFMVCTVFIHIAISLRSVDVCIGRTARHFGIGSQREAGIAEQVAHIPFRGFHAQGISRGSDTLYHADFETIVFRKHNGFAFLYFWHATGRISHGQRTVCVIVAGRNTGHVELQIHIIRMGTAVIADVYLDCKLVGFTRLEYPVFRQGVMVILLTDGNLDELASLLQGLWHNHGRSGTGTSGSHIGFDVGNAFRYGIQFPRLRVEARGNVRSAEGNASPTQVDVTVIDKRYIDLGKFVGKVQSNRIGSRRSGSGCPKQIAVQVTFLRALVGAHRKGLTGSGVTGMIRMVGSDGSIGCTPIGSSAGIAQRTILSHCPGYIFVYSSSTRNGDTYFLSFYYLGGLQTLIGHA